MPFSSISRALFQVIVTGLMYTSIVRVYTVLDPLYTERVELSTM